MVYNVIVVKLSTLSTFCATGFEKGRLGFCDKGDGDTLRVIKVRVENIMHYWKSTYPRINAYFFIGLV